MNHLKKQNKIRIFAGLFVLFVAMSCSSTKSVISSGKASDKLSAKQVVKQHQKNNADFKTLQAKAQIEIVQNGKENSYTFSFRMEKDKIIWLSAPIGIARMMITPESVRFYNKLGDEYFDGDYKLLSEFVGIDLDFQKVQNILLGQAIYDLKSQSQIVSISNNSYAVAPKVQLALLELFYLINPSHFKMDSLQLFQQLKKRMLQVDYSSYQMVKNQVLPKNIRVVAVEDSEEVVVSLEFKSVTLDEVLRFPFKIPSGYKEIIIK